MPAGPELETFRELCSALERLRVGAGAVNAVVLDAWYDLWCRALPLSVREQELALGILRRALSSSEKPLPQGGRVLWIDAQGEPPAFAQSFAGVYVLVLWFARQFSELSVRRAIAQSLPAIEALTIALPPPEGLAVGSGPEPARAHVRTSLPPESRTDPAGRISTAEQLARFGLYPEAAAQLDALADLFTHAAPSKAIAILRRLLRMVSEDCPELAGEYRSAWLRLASLLELGGDREQAEAARRQYEALAQPRAPEQLG